ncbi:hypothetical protein SKAU_G00211570 [Synaphobranchus kaupii]|uniref:Uncharacterized protein n=1 Tax=Synaphobranchus kaupii TaxID=118154 RepID=A0A9Q1F945_SYNKA|nr:hypothetical protein SKAU_G00211570 [Synaphobranchus kaupii]
MRASKWINKCARGVRRSCRPKNKNLEADAAKCAKITDMFAAGAAVASTSIVPDIVQQQVQLEGGEVAGHGHCQAEEQACDREAEEGQSEHDRAEGQSEQELEESVVEAKAKPENPVVESGPWPGF